jgi:hypothetical protein
MTGGLEEKGTGRRPSADARATNQAGLCSDADGDLASDNWSLASQFVSPAGKRARTRFDLSNKSRCDRLGRATTGLAFELH